MMREENGLDGYRSYEMLVDVQENFGIELVVINIPGGRVVRTMSKARENVSTNGGVRRFSGGELNANR